jgi:hypothetical protein
LKHINIPVPEHLIEELTRAIKEAVRPCPKHNCEHVKHIEALDDCQQGLLQAIETIGFGEVVITIEEGRPVLLRVTQSLKFGADDVERLGWMIVDRVNKQEKKIIPFSAQL